MSSHLDTFYKEVVDKICLDFDREEVREVKSGIEILLNRFIGTLQEEHSSFDIKSVAACGSMAEGTKILTKELEYDFLAVMETWPGCGKLGFIPSCDGCMQVIGENSEEKIPTTVCDKFLHRLCDVINKKCEENGCQKNVGSDCDKIYLDNGCSYCTLNTKTGNLCISVFLFQHYLNSKLRFQWFGASHVGRPKQYSIYSRSQSDTNMNFFSIESCMHKSLDCEDIFVDFHPVFRIKRNNIKCSNFQEQSGYIQETNMFIFPNSVQTHSSICWRISTYDQELKLLREATEEHRQAYMILRFLLNRLSEYDESRSEKDSILKNIGSYVIKCAILQHTKNCNSTKPTVVCCVKETLTYLSEAFISETLPSVFTGYNVLKSNVQLWQKENRHQRCQIIGHSLQSIIDILYTGLHENSEDFMIDLHLVSWTLQDTKMEHLWQTSARFNVYPQIFDVERFRKKLDDVVRCRKHTDTNLYLHDIAVMDFIRANIGLRKPIVNISDGIISVKFQGRKTNPIQITLDDIKSLSPGFYSVVTYYILKLLVKLIICESHLRALTLF